MTIGETRQFRWRATPGPLPLLQHAEGRQAQLAQGQAAGRTEGGHLREDQGEGDGRAQAVGAVLVGLRTRMTALS